MGAKPLMQLHLHNGNCQWQIGLPLADRSWLKTSLSILGSTPLAHNERRSHTPWNWKRMGGNLPLWTSFPLRGWNWQNRISAMLWGRKHTSFHESAGDCISKTQYSNSSLAVYYTAFGVICMVPFTPKRESFRVFNNCLVCCSCSVLSGKVLCTSSWAYLSYHDCFRSCWLTKEFMLSLNC